MKVISLVENNTICGCKTAHGLSLYIEAENNKILFDLGPDDTLFENAEKLNVNLQDVNIVVISHGHRDHGGALKSFLLINKTAQIYIHEEAFLPHRSHRPTGIADIGLDIELKKHPQITLTSGNYAIDSNLLLFTVSGEKVCLSGANSSLYEGDKPDEFKHEQNLIIKGNKTVLIMGCGHNGVVNIMASADSYNPQICIGGFHLTNPSAKRNEPVELLNSIIEKLSHYPNTHFYTCHCTGVNVYNYLASKMDNIKYLHCGDVIDI